MAAVNRRRERSGDPAFKPAVGLEIHAQLATRSKLFCACPVAFDASANHLTCPVCLGLPGTLPVLNAGAVALATRIALALDCRIAATSTFARKHYFYPDLPRNYQITQYQEPLARGGHVQLAPSGTRTTVTLQRIHLEEDAGRSRHDHGAGQTLVDLNRAGVPLVEIVTAPELGSGAEVRACCADLRRLLIYLEACGGNLERGELRCDANVSVRPRAQETLGTRVELKNLNSLRALQRAVDFEIERQTAMLVAGSEVRAETRAWDPARQESFVLRSKESEPDYRYLPEPDLPPLIVGDDLLATQRQALPELPVARATRLAQRYGLPTETAGQLTSTPALADYFEAAVNSLLEAAAADAVLDSAGSARSIANWLLGEIASQLNERGWDLAVLPVSPEHLSRLVMLVHRRQISGTQAKEVLAEMIDTGAEPATVIKKWGLELIADSDQLGDLVRLVLAAHPREVMAWRGGKAGLLQYFVGEVMRASSGRADPMLVAQLVEAELVAE